MQRESYNSVKIFYPEFNREDLIKKININFSELTEKLDLKLVVLFGSYARGKHTVASDVDILIVHNSPPAVDAYKLVKEILKIPRLEPHVYTLMEYKEMKETIGKMTKDGIILFFKNIEEENNGIME